MRVLLSRPFSKRDPMEKKKAGVLSHSGLFSSSTTKNNQTTQLEFVAGLAVIGQIETDGLFFRTRPETHNGFDDQGDYDCCDD